MEYKDLLNDFIKRTNRNLRLIQNEAAAGKKAYEVTQLINSMLGLLVFPQQQFYEEIPKIPLEELKNDGWPVPRVRGDYPQAKDLKILARYLRNGIAHFNLKFTETNKEIDGIVIWNKRGKNKTWEAELKINELQAITKKFTDLLLKD